MKRLLLYCLSIFITATGTAQTYEVVDSRSSVKFTIKNFGMDTDGKLSGVEGSIRFDPSDLTTAVFTVSIDPATINTDIEPRDINLKEAQYLDVKRYPRISFEAKQVSRAGKTGTYLMKGILTLKGIKKQVLFPFRTRTADDGIIFSGEMKLSRADFGIGSGSMVLSDNFTVLLSVFARRV